MSTIATGSFPKGLWPGVRAWVQNEYAKHETMYTDIFDMKKSKKAYEEDVQMSGFGFVPVKSEGGAVAQDSTKQGYVTRYTHVTRGMMYIITQEMMEDEQYPLMKKMAENLAFSFRSTKEQVAADVLNRGFNSAYTFGDGKELFATDHPTAAGAFSNELATPADFSEAALEDILILIGQAKNDKGHPVKIRPKCLIGAPSQEFEFARVLESTLTPGSDNNAQNIVKSHGMLPGGYKINPYLEDDDAWYVKTDCPHGMVGFDRRPFTFTRDNEFSTDNMQAKGTERYSFGNSDPRGMFASAGAA